MEIILDELIQHTTEKINNNQSNANFTDKYFLHVINDNEKNIINVNIFKYDYSEINNIVCEKTTNPNFLHELYLFEYNFNFEILFNIITNIQHNQGNNFSNKLRKIEMIHLGTKINIINRYEGLKKDNLPPKFKSNIYTLYI
jgi:hypothetical protein